MAQIGMHVRAADADAVDLDQMLAGAAQDPAHRGNPAFQRRINQCLHFAVNPPSTIRTCPVT